MELSVRGGGKDHRADVVTSELPLISIVTPSLNQGRFIERTIRSVIAQDYPSIEYLIIDGGSKDSTVSIIEKYQNDITYWVSETDSGQSHAINKGIEKCAGDIVSWINSDDFLLDGAVSKVVESYRRAPHAGGWFGGMRRENTEGVTVLTRHPRGLSHEEILNWEENWVAQPACFFSRRAFEEVGRVDEGLHYAMDFDLWIRLSEEYEIVRVPDLLAGSIHHEDMKTQAKRPEMHIETWMLQIANGHPEYAMNSMRSVLYPLYRRARRAEELSSMLPIRIVQRIQNLLKAMRRGSRRSQE